MMSPVFDLGTLAPSPSPRSEGDRRVAV